MDIYFLVFSEQNDLSCSDTNCPSCTFLRFIQLSVSCLRSEKIPPGPFHLPIIGNLLFLGAEPHDVFHRLVKEYGDVYGFSFGMNRMVIIKIKLNLQEKHLYRKVLMILCLETCLGISERSPSYSKLF